MTRLDEKRAAGASYILQFYSDVRNLTIALSNYLNSLAEINSKYGDNVETLTKLDDQEKDSFFRIMQTTRQAVIVTYLSIKSISSKIEIDKKETSKLDKYYKDIKLQKVIKADDIENYTIQLNKCLVNDIIQTLLENSQNLIDSIYDEPKPGNE